MTESTAQVTDGVTGPGTEPYQPPQVEVVLTADELAREVLYAGAVSGKKTT